MSKEKKNILIPFENDIRKSLEGLRANPKYQERLLQLAYQIGNNHKLADCVPSTIAEAIINGLSLGLDPNPSLGQFYLVAYGRKCSLLVGYKGWVQLAARAGITLWGDVIRSEDDYEYCMGSHPNLSHAPSIYPKDKRGDVIASYCCWVRKDMPQFVVPEVVRREDIDKARSQASAKSPAWNNWFERMAIKTAINRAANTMPLTAEMGLALTYDHEFNIDMADEAKPITVKVIEPENNTPELPEKSGAETSTANDIVNTSSDIEFVQNNSVKVIDEPKKTAKKKKRGRPRKNPKSDEPKKEEKQEQEKYLPVQAGEQMALDETVEAIIAVGIDWNDVSPGMQDAMRKKNTGFDFSVNQISGLTEKYAQKLLAWVKNYKTSDKYKEILKAKKKNNKGEQKGIEEIDLSDLD